MGRVVEGEGSGEEGGEGEWEEEVSGEGSGRRGVEGRRKDLAMTLCW